VLDEVDAPLDDANIERFCDLLDAMTRETDTRYLIVTHNAVTMSRMHRLFGVTMVEQGVSPPGQRRSGRSGAVAGGGVTLTPSGRGFPSSPCGSPSSHRRAGQIVRSKDFGALLHAADADDGRGDEIMLFRPGGRKRHW
jgi:hypothetical protein